MKRKMTMMLMMVVCLAAVLWAGDLNPSAPPTSGTMKSLDQVEPRIPIDTIPIVIDQPGSYYLTGDFTCTAARAIDITVSDVTLDLCGYTLTGSGTAADNGVYIYNLENIEIRNGVLRDFDQYGIYAGGGSVRNIRAFDVRAIHNGRTGLYLYGYVSSPYEGGGHLVQRCTAGQNGYIAAGYGIYVGYNSVVLDCTSIQNTGAGINTWTGCVVKNCTASHNTLKGIDGGYYNTIQDNSVQSNLDGGIYVGRGSVIQGNSVLANENDYGLQASYGCVIRNNTVSLGVGAGTGRGIYADYSSEVSGNSVYANEDWGIRAYYGCNVHDNAIYGNNSAGTAGAGGLYCTGFNRITNNHLSRNTGYNLYVVGSGQYLIGNTINGTAADVGIYFSSSSNFYKDNIVSGNATNFDGSVPGGSLDGGGNVGF